MACRADDPLRAARMPRQSRRSVSGQYGVTHTSRKDTKSPSAATWPTCFPAWPTASSNPSPCSPQEPIPPPRQNILSDLHLVNRELARWNSLNQPSYFIGGQGNGSLLTFRGSPD